MIVLDSSFLIGFYNEQDTHHAAACSLMERFLAGTWGQGLLLEYVFLETMTVLLVRRDISSANRVGRVLLDGQELEFVPCSDFFLETMEAFTNQGATGLSFAGAAIAVVARQRAGGKILSFDEKFRKIKGLQVNPQ